MLEIAAERVAGSVIRRHLLFTAATLFVVIVVGYHFGTGDQVLHIPFLKQSADPTLYPNDAFLQLRRQHYSYFWYFFVPLLRLGLLEAAMFVVHVLATYCAFWALWALSDELFHNPLTNLLAIVSLAYPHVGFAGWPPFEFSLLNRTFVFPFLLLALRLYLRKRYWLAFALLGALYNLHVVSVNFALAMCLFAGLVEWRRVGPRNLAIGLVLFVVCALPVLIWKVSQSPVDLSLRPEWMDVVARSILANIFFLFAPNPFVLFGTLSGVGAVALYLFARREGARSPHDKTVSLLVTAAMLLVGGVLITQWLPITILVQSQILRAGVFVLVFAYLYAAEALAARYRALGRATADWLLLLFAIVTSVLTVVPLVVWLVQRWVRSARTRRLLAGGLSACMLAATFVAAARLNLWAPGIHRVAPATPWVQAQLWARNNTPTDTVFITPPYYWWLYDPGWRVYSERSNVAELSDLLEIAFSPDYLPVWRPRFEAVAPGALARFQGDLPANWEIGAQAYYGLSAVAIAEAARKYGAAYLVVEKARSPARPWPVVYENASYRIYDLRSLL